MKTLKNFDLNIYNIIKNEFFRQSRGLNLIASENYVSDNILTTMGSIFTNKYAEGYPFKRYYSGCKEYDNLESIAMRRAKNVFSADHANVQLHSGANANLAVYQAFLNPGDTILSMHLDHGGHLTHGAIVSNIGRIYNIVSYGVTPDYEVIDYKGISELASKHHPKIIIAGASAYSRTIDFKEFSKIAKKNSALLMIDISHISGLIAANVHPSPFPFADIVTSTTHKTLRGPRGGMILCKKEYKSLIDKSVFPGLQGGPLMNNVLAKAVCFKEAQHPMFTIYQTQVIKNAKHLSNKLFSKGFKLVSDGTDTHLMLIKVHHLNLNGKECQEKLEAIDIFVNKNKIPFDIKNAIMASGIRIGTAAVTTLGMQEYEMGLIADIIRRCLLCNDSRDILKKEVHALTTKFSNCFFKQDIF